MTALSVLDLSPIPEGAGAAEALRHSVDLARHAEAWGYRSVWVAEHHALRANASAAPAVLIGQILAATSTIRVGAGGVILPNHAPLVIAEQFGTLAAFHPGRIDLGLGRAPVLDAATARALRRDPDSADYFADDLIELRDFLDGAEGAGGLRAIPGAGAGVPLWVLGTSPGSAALAGSLGLPYAFATHFGPAPPGPALRRYRGAFRPSMQERAPRVALSLSVCAAGTDAEACHLFTSVQQHVVNVRRGRPRELPPPADTARLDWSDAERTGVARILSAAVVGSPATVRAGLEAVMAEHAPDEIFVTTQIFDHGARLRSFEIVAGLASALEEAPGRRRLA